jgi:hypothetical protein
VIEKHGAFAVKLLRKLSEEGLAESSLDKIDAETEGPPDKCSLETMCDEHFEVLC